MAQCAIEPDPFTERQSSRAAEWVSSRKGRLGASGNCFVFLRLPRTSMLYLCNSCEGFWVNLPSANRLVLPQVKPYDFHVLWPIEYLAGEEVLRQQPETRKDQSAQQSI